MGDDNQVSNAMRKTLLVVSCTLLAIGNCGGPLMIRLYFIHGGKILWLSSWLQTIGFPIILIPLAVSYFYRRKIEGPNAKLILMNLPVVSSAAVLGILVGITNYMYSYGLARLPVSTAALIIATQLIFTALSAFFLVKQKFTAYSINAIVLLTIGAVVLAVHAISDRPEGESNKSYVLSFGLTFLAAFLGGLAMPLIELVYKKAKEIVSYTLVMELQLVMCMSASVFTTIGMLVNSDFKEISREAREYQLGEAKYYVVLVSNALIWQFYILGAVGVVFCSSALVFGITVTVLLPVSQVLAVLIYHDKFKIEKGVALILCLWGFASYFYGEFKNSKKRIRIQESEMATSSGTP